MRYVDTKKREEEILRLVVESYIKESRPISSGYLCERFNLPYSSATVRNVMGVLEKKGLLFHVHTSSGRVPTREGFKRYVEIIKEKEEMLRRKALEEREWSIELNFVEDLEDILTRAVDILADVSGYPSLLAISGEEEKILFRGTRFFFEQPEFEDVKRLRSIFYVLEEKIHTLWELLFEYFDEHINILLGDEMEFEEISDCALVISGLHKKNIVASLALLGPIRMNYQKAIVSLYAVKEKLQGLLRRIEL